MKKYLLILFVSAGCNFSNIDYSKINIISSLVQTEKVERDIDDPAIWYNKTNPSKSLIIGTQLLMYITIYNRVFLIERLYLMLKYVIYQYHRQS